VFESSLAVSGFVGAFTRGFTMPGCGTTDHLHAQIVIGGPGLDGIQAATARTLGTAQRELTGTVTRAGVPADGVDGHAVDANGDYLTRVTTDAAGHFTLHVPMDADVRVDAYRRGDQLASATIGLASDPVTIDLPATGAIHVVATEGAARVPVRIQVVPAAGQ